MVTLENKFVVQAIKKTLGLGGAAMILCTLIWDRHIALSVAAGVGVAVGNIAFMAWFIRRVFSRGGHGYTGALGWSLLFLLKLLVLFGLTYYVLVVVRLNALGYSAGYIILLIALTWQGLIQPATND